MVIKYRWTKSAASDLQEIVDYIAVDNTKAALKIAKKIVLTAQIQLTKFQNIGKPGRIYGTRELAIKQTPYIVVYKVNSNTVEALRIFHVARRWPESYEELNNK